MNPNMANDKLRWVCEELGYNNIQSFISSGNLLFESDKSPEEIEAELETSWQEKLGFTSMTVVRSSEQLQKLIKHDPFKGMTHGDSSYLLVTFFKRSAKPAFKMPFQPVGKTYKVLGYNDRALFTVTDNTGVPTTDLMTWLEKQFGKDITSRTWNTINRISKRL